VHSRDFKRSGLMPVQQLKESRSHVEGKPLEGTIIDLETIGPIKNGFRDTRRYENVRPYIFGYRRKYNT